MKEDLLNIALPDSPSESALHLSTLPINARTHYFIGRLTYVKAVRLNPLSCESLSLRDNLSPNACSIRLDLSIVTRVDKLFCVYEPMPREGRACVLSCWRKV
jgi:hypothetical protein